jgi:hypothetical protein
MSRKDTHHPGCASLTFTLEGDTEMFRKPTTVLPIALLLGAVSAAPVLAQTSSDYPGAAPSAIQRIPRHFPKRWV